MFNIYGRKDSALYKIQTKIYTFQENRLENVCQLQILTVKHTLLILRNKET